MSIDFVPLKRVYLRVIRGPGAVADIFGVKAS